MRLLLLVLLVLVSCGVEPSMERSRDSLTQAVKDIKAEGRRLNERIVGKDYHDNRTYVTNEEVASELLHDLTIYTEKLVIIIEEQQELIEAIDVPVEDKCPGRSEGKGKSKED